MNGNTLSSCLFPLANKLLPIASGRLHLGQSIDSIFLSFDDKGQLINHYIYSSGPPILLCIDEWAQYFMQNCFPLLIVSSMHAFNLVRKSLDEEIVQLFSAKYEKFGSNKVFKSKSSPEMFRLFAMEPQ